MKTAHALYRDNGPLRPVCFLAPIGVMYQSNRSFNIPLGIPRAVDAFSCPGGREFDDHSSGVGNLIARVDVMLRDKS